MLKDPTAFRRGSVILVAWIAWFAAGALYASSQGDIRSYLDTMPPNAKLVFYAWLFVSTTLLYYAVLFLFRGLLQGASRPPA
jgi:hypothetical protein